jgi:hypothetical protein
MDHAEVREQLEAAALVPGALARLIASTDDPAHPVPAHIRSCAVCRREAEALQATADTLAWAAPDDLRAPAEARARVLAAVAQSGAVRRPRSVSSEPTRPALVPIRARTAMPRWNTRLITGLGAAAGIALLAGAVLAGRDIATQRDAALERADAYAQVVAVTDEALRDPDHRLATLSAPGGTATGTVLISPAHDEVVMVADALPALPGEERYRCFVERDGRRTPIGWMWVDDEVSYWAGPIEGVEDLGRAGDTVIVSADPDGDDPALLASF